MYIDEIGGYTIYRYPWEYEVIDPLGRGYGFPTENEAREWAVHEASVQGWR